MAAGAASGVGMNPTTDRPVRRTQVLPYVVTALLLLVGWQVATRGAYEAGSGVGYQFGLVGGIAMLVLLLYPLAKRIGWLRRALALKHWFRLHMLLGVAGPLLVLLHTRLSFGSINGAVAFAAMAIVFASGLIGRFIYTKIHHGLYGRRLTLAEVKARLGLSGENARSKLRFHPALEARLAALEQRVAGNPAGAGVLRLFTLGPTMRWQYWRAARMLKARLREEGARRDWDGERFARAYRQGCRLLRAYLGAIRDVGQFGAYERLFSFWHLLHIPLMVLLLLTGVIHVIAVHMY
jgi:hypothetical protein